MKQPILIASILGGGIALGAIGVAGIQALKPAAPATPATPAAWPATRCRKACSSAIR